MARITVATSHPVGAEGGHLVIARALVSALGEAGHETTLLHTPQNRFGRQASAYVATWLTDVGVTHDGRPVDQVISLRYPSYAVRHPVHVCWLNHRMREYYDQWWRFSASLSPQARLKERVRRRFMHTVDRQLLTRNVTRVFAQSRTIQERLERWGGISSNVLHPPPPPRAYRCDSYEDFVLVVSRLTPMKRVGLVIQALAEPVACGVRCIVIGDGEEREALDEAVRERGLDDRVSFLGAVSEDILIDQLGRCRAVCFPALAEDYGLVTVEAFAAGKAVVTCHDSGGPTELVRDGENGFIVEPSPAAIAQALAALTDDCGQAEQLGARARAQASEMTWDRVFEKLLLVD